MTYASPIGPWAGPGRIDQGVDYTGSGDLFAIGDGIIVGTSGPGWPGGTYINLKLDNPVAGAQYVYYAENIAPSVKPGQRVKAGEKVGHARGGFPFVEIGFSNSSGTDNTMANQTGQSKRGISAGDPGRFSTGWGVAMSDFIKSLGGKPGIVSPGGISGTVPSIGATGTPATQQAGLTSASGGIGGILGIPSEITTFFDSADKLVTGLMWIMKPSNWLRIGAFLAGVVLIMLAIRAFILIGEGQSPLKAPDVVPIPV